MFQQLPLSSPQINEQSCFWKAVFLTLWLIPAHGWMNNIHRKNWLLDKSISFTLHNGNSWNEVFGWNTCFYHFSPHIFKKICAKFLWCTAFQTQVGGKHILCKYLQSSCVTYENISGFEHKGANTYFSLINTIKTRRKELWSIQCHFGGLCRNA